MSVSLRWLPVLAFSMATTALGQGTSTLFVIKNSTGVPDDAVYVNVDGDTLTNVFGGPGAAMTPFTAGGNQIYSLKQIYSSVPSAGPGGPTGSNIPNISSEKALSARLVANVGSPTGTVNGLVEMTMNRYNEEGVQNNVDVSYVNSISLPVNIAIRYRTNGALVPITLAGLQQNQVQTTPGATIFTNLTASTAITPLTARVTANYNAVSDSGLTIGTITGIAEVLSPTFSPPPSGYHDWSDLISSGATATVASYSVPSGQPLQDVLYGFTAVTAAVSGAIPSSPFVTNISTLSGPNPSVADTNNVFLAAQNYNLTATFTSNLNPGNANTRISNLSTSSITDSMAGVLISGYGGATGSATSSTVGNFNVYITESQLNNPAGIYGANPEYVIDWVGNVTPSAVATQNTNSLADRVVGDLLAAINFGQIGSTTAIGAHMTATETANNFVGSQWTSSETATVGSLGTGEYFYLLALQPSTQEFAEWSGSGIQTSDLAYNTYGNAFQSLTQAYSYAYSDRINSSRAIDPDIFYSPVSLDSQINLDEIYIEVELLAGGYIYTVPEPSNYALFSVVATAAVVYGLRRRMPAMKDSPVNGTSSTVFPSMSGS